MRKSFPALSGIGLLVLVAGAVTLGPLAGTLPADPPADQEYTGTKRCASCHFEQYMAYRKSGHSKAFETLTAKYQADATCLKCHTTGFGEATGFKDNDSTPALAGVGCESCHGPGSKHEEISQQFKTIKDLSPEQEQLVKGSIWKMLPKNVCVECHQVQAHKKSATPPEMQK